MKHIIFFSELAVTKFTVIEWAQKNVWVSGYILQAVVTMQI